jgi:hypothetical protein
MTNDIDLEAQAAAIELRRPCSARLLRTGTIGRQLTRPVAKFTNPP